MYFAVYKTINTEKQNPVEAASSVENYDDYFVGENSQVSPMESASQLHVNGTDISQQINSEFVSVEGFQKSHPKFCIDGGWWTHVDLQISEACFCR